MSTSETIEMARTLVGSGFDSDEVWCIITELEHEAELTGEDEWDILDAWGYL